MITDNIHAVVVEHAGKARNLAATIRTGIVTKIKVVKEKADG